MERRWRVHFQMWDDGLVYTRYITPKGGSTGRHEIRAVQPPRSDVIWVERYPDRSKSKVDNVHPRNAVPSPG